MFRAIGKSKIAFVLAIVFGLSLFFFRGGSKYSNIFNSDNIIASVSGTPISTTKFNRSLQISINQFNQMIGKSMSSEEKTRVESGSREWQFFHLNVLEIYFF